MNRRIFLGTLACAGLPAQSRPGVVAKFAKLDIGAAKKAGVRALELDGDLLPPGLAAARAMRDRLTKAGLTVRAVSWRLTKEAGLTARLSAANALDARYAVLLSPGALVPKLQSESLRTGVPVAVRNGLDGFRTPDEIVEVLRVNSHLSIALDPAQMLADGHDPGVFVRRALRRLTTVYFTPRLDDSARTSLLRTLYALRARSTATIETRIEDFPRAVALLERPGK